VDPIAETVIYDLVNDGFSPGSGITRHSGRSIPLVSRNVRGLRAVHFKRGGPAATLTQSAIVSFERPQFGFSEWRNWREFLLIVNVQEEEKLLLREVCERRRAQTLRPSILRRWKCFAQFLESPSDALH
jgi:hypothetical protein